VSLASHVEPVADRLVCPVLSYAAAECDHLSGQILHNLDASRWMCMGDGFFLAECLAKAVRQ
jgi:hypothetical protein